MAFSGLCWLYPIPWEKKLGSPGCKNSFCNWSSSQKSLLPAALESVDSLGSSQQSPGSEVQSIIIQEEHTGIQADMVQEEQRVLDLHLKAASRILASGQLG